MSQTTWSFGKVWAAYNAHDSVHLTSPTTAALIYTFGTGSIAVYVTTARNLFGLQDLSFLGHKIQSEYEASSPQHAL